MVQLTNESRAVTKNYECASFGNEVRPDVKDDNRFRYWIGTTYINNFILNVLSLLVAIFI